MKNVMKTCPYCAEQIQNEAIKCRYCGEWLDDRQHPERTSNVLYSPSGYAWNYEYKSEAEFLGWPLIHIAQGINPDTGAPRVAKGVIAIGNFAIGGLAVGGLAAGAVTLGGLGIGLFSFGGLVIGILAADQKALDASIKTIEANFGSLDLTSDVWPFKQTDYYKDQTGINILRQFVSINELIEPGKIAGIKHQTNKIEQDLAENLKHQWPRPVNLDPGIIEPSKLVLATTKNYSHRIYIGQKMYAEVTLIYDKGKWKPFEYTYPDYKQQEYWDFFSKVRKKLLEQLKS